MTDYRPAIRNYLDREIETIKKLDVEAINKAVNVLMEARDRDADIYIFGNGGSSATASHFVCDFNKGAYEKLGGRKFKFHCLSDNTPVITAIANDIGYEDVFSYQLEGILKPSDLVIAISGSGNSKNIIKAVEYAKKIGTKILGITGFDGGRLRQLADYHLDVDIKDMQIAEDLHMIFDHMMLCIMQAEDIQI